MVVSEAEGRWRGAAPDGVHGVSREHLVRTFAAAPNAMFVASRVGRLLHANPAMGRLVGRPLAELDGADLADLIDADDVAAERLAFADVAGADAPIATELRWRTATDRIVWSETTLTPVRCDGHDGVILGHVEDRSRMIELEAHLGHLIGVELSDRAAVRIAHDTNNALTVVLAHLDLATEVGPGEEADHHTELATNALRRAIGMLQQLVDASRVQRPRLELVDLEQLCRRMSRILQAALPNSIVLRVEAAPGTASLVRADPAELERVLTTLVMNARDAIADRGEITLAVRDVPSSARQPGEADSVELAVIDDGRGMDADTQARALEPFFTTKGACGLGIGLTHAAQLVRRQRGSLTIESTEGVGTEIRLRIPRATQPLAPRPLHGSRR